MHMYGNLGFVGDQVTIEREIQRVDQDGGSCGRKVQGTEVLNIPAMPIIKGVSVVNSRGVLPVVIM